MKRRVRTKKESVLPAKWIFTIGFLCGILIPNFMWKKVYLQRNITAAFFLLCLKETTENTMDILENVFQKRLGIFCVTGLCGFTVFGVPIAWLVLFFMGFEMGSIMTCSILQFGFKGGIFGIGLFLPQYILYLPAMFGVCSLSYQKSMTLWKNQILFQKSMYGYLGKMFLLALLLVGGILLENYWNPILVCRIMEYLKIFF